MQQDTNTIEMSAEEEAILGRFAQRASEAASVSGADDGTNMIFMLLMVL